MFFLWLGGEWVLLGNASSGMSTYRRPESVDEVWMREQILRDLENIQKKKKEASMWMEKCKHTIIGLL
jgi:hypothetical protein